MLSEEASVLEYITNFYREFPYPLGLVTQKVNTDPDSALDGLPVTPSPGRRGAHCSWRLRDGCAPHWPEPQAFPAMEEVGDYWPDWYQIAVDYSVCFPNDWGKAALVLQAVVCIQSPYNY